MTRLVYAYHSMRPVRLARSELGNQVNILTLAGVARYSADEIPAGGVVNAADI